MVASKVLKETTKNKHRAVDRHQAMSMLMAPSMTLLAYTQILEDLHTWLSRLHVQLASLGLQSRYDPLRKISLLEQDLTNLGISKAAPTSAISPSLDYHFCLGVHYVVEGSTLGAQYIAPRVSQTLNRDDVTHYFRGYGDDVMTLWQLTSEWLDQELPCEKSQKTAVEGAMFAFDSLLQILNRRGHL